VNLAILGFFCGGRVRGVVSANEGANIALKNPHFPLSETNKGQFSRPAKGADSGRGKPQLFGYFLGQKVFIGVHGLQPP
jgi:hypothetical protein